MCFLVRRLHNLFCLSSQRILQALITTKLILVDLTDLNSTEVSSETNIAPPVFGPGLPAVSRVGSLVDQTQIPQCLPDHLVFIKSFPVEVRFEYF